MKKWIARFVREEAGQDLIEYAMLAAFIALALIAAVTAVGDSLNTAYGNVSSQIPGGS